MNIGSKGQHDLRKTIIRMLKDGKKGSQIAKDLGVSMGHVSNVKRLYEEGGASALKPKKRDRPAGNNKVLGPEQEKEIQKNIVDKTPEQMCFKECMWTRKNIGQLIKEKYNIDIKLSTLGYYLARWGFTVQRPVKRAYKQDEMKIDEWLNSEFPGITERAEKEEAEIFFGDETNIQNTATYARGYAPNGQTPVVRIEAQKLKIEMLSAISKRGKLRFMLYKDSMNAEKLIDYMMRLITDSKKKVFLILDNLRVHHANWFRPGWRSTRIGSNCFSCRPTLQNTIRTNCSTVILNVMPVQNNPQEPRQSLRQMSRIIWIILRLPLLSSPLSFTPRLLGMPLDIHEFIEGAIYTERTIRED